MKIDWTPIILIGGIAGALYLFRNQIQDALGGMQEALSPGVTGGYTLPKSQAEFPSTSIWDWLIPPIGAVKAIEMGGALLQEKQATPQLPPDWTRLAGTVQNIRTWQAPTVSEKPSPLVVKYAGKPKFIKALRQPLVAHAISQHPVMEKILRARMGD